MDEGQDAHFEHTDSGYGDHEMVNGRELEIQGEGFSNFELKATHEAKLRELLRNIVSIEIKLCSDSCKEFKKLLRASYGGELLHLYVRTSSKLSELLEAWKIRRGKRGLSYILSLMSVILDHPMGKYKPNDPARIAVSRALDKYAKLIVEAKMEDIYSELNSNEGKRQKAVLLLMASIVRRGSGLAAELAKTFDFKLPIFPKLAEYKRKKVEAKKHSTRGAFIEFAMSFLEVGKPGLLRWILQQKDMLSGILRGLGDDDEETVVYVLATLRDRVLIPQSLVPPGLRSVLFGSVTLEQLVNISARENGGLAAEVAHNVLIMVCTDPSNGLMPDSKRSLTGNPKRLLALMKRLYATEINYHEILLLAIVSGRLSLASAYLDEFPYNLEDPSSPTWPPAISLAANLVSSASKGLLWDFLSQAGDEPSLHSVDVQSVLKCVCPRPFNRSVVNKGLLNRDPLVKHATLRLILENLKLLDSFINALSMSGMTSLKQGIQNEVRILLPDSQVLFTLLNAIGNDYSKTGATLKRSVDSVGIASEEKPNIKKLKVEVINEDIDIVVGGINCVTAGASPQRGQTGKLIREKLDEENHQLDLTKIWMLEQFPAIKELLDDAEVYFCCKVLEVLKIYHRNLKPVLEVSYDLFKVIPSNPVALPNHLLQSLLSVLIEDVCWSPNLVSLCRILPPIYKYLQHFLNLLLYSSSLEIKSQAYVLAEAAMMSTGSFDNNPREIGAWFLFLPGYMRDNISAEHHGLDILQNLCPAVVKFLCDAVITVGKYRIKYWDLVKCHLDHSHGHKERSVKFSPLIVCVLEQCLRLLSSESGTSPLPTKSVISSYICNTLKYLLQTQVEAGLLSSLICHFLSQRLEGRLFPENAMCEWRPLKYLLSFSQSIIRNETRNLFHSDRNVFHSSSSLAIALDEVRKVLSGDCAEIAGVSKAFYFTMMCAGPDEILKNFPKVMSISRSLSEIHLSSVTSLFFLDQSLLCRASELWPDVFFAGMEMCVKEMSSRSYNSHLSPSEIDSCIDFDSTLSASIAFSSFLNQASFHVLFPAIISSDYKKHHPKFEDLLLAKLANLTTDHLISSLRLVLFWIHQIESSYKQNPSGDLESLSDLCYKLLHHILSRLLTVKADPGCSTTSRAKSIHNAQEVAVTIFCHPAVTASLSCDTCQVGHGDVMSEEYLLDNIEGFLCVSQQKVSIMDQQAIRLLSTTSDYLSALCSSCSSFNDDGKTSEIVNTFKTVIQRIFLIFKKRLDHCVRSRDLMPLLPAVYATLALLHLTSPLELLKLVMWMFTRFDLEDLIFLKTSNFSLVDLGFCIASSAFKMLSTYLRLPNTNTKGAPSTLFWGIKQDDFDADILEIIYSKAFACSTQFKLNSADECLLEAVNVVHKLKYKKGTLPMSMKMTRVVASTPIEIISHCIHRTNHIKAKLLLFLVQMSPLHMSIFGHLFSDILNKALLGGSTNYALSDEDYLLLLPAALVYLNSSITTYGGLYFKKIEFLPSHYSMVLIDGFLNWKSFVTKTAFKMRIDDDLPSSSDQLLHYSCSSVLGLSIQMLHYYFASSRDLLDERLNLFDAICPRAAPIDDALDLDVEEGNPYSSDQLLNLVNGVVAKISLCKILLFPQISQIQVPPMVDHGEKNLNLSENKRMKLSRTRFIDALVCSWQLVVKKFPTISDDSEDQSTLYTLFKMLEVLLLRYIDELIIQMCDTLVELDSLPFVEKLVRFSLLHRFGDPTTMNVLRHILISLSHGNLPTELFLQMLLAHSQLIPTINTASDSNSCLVAGIFMKPISGILRSLFRFTEKSCTGRPKSNRKQLEIIKLLRTLFHLKANQCGLLPENDKGISYKELIFLLLSCYGATLSETDIEIYSLMHEIEMSEGVDSGKIAEHDYLWGNAVLRIRTEQSQEQDAAMNNDLCEIERDRQRSLFRDNLSLDPKLCVATVLYFPYERIVSGDYLSSILLNDNATNMHEAKFAKSDTTLLYDPVFILNFSIHCLSRDYADPVEFAGLGLLAVAFVSLSSPDDGIRKLGYKVLGKFNERLQNCRKKKEVTRLRLLTYLQNGIQEPWQRVPSIIAVFVAEASLILLDPSHDHYSAISKHLMQSPRADMRRIPMFHEFFWSTSVNYKIEQLWMLRLLYTGINVEDDARLYIQNSVFDILLSFYASPLSDYESNEWILQIVKKSVKLQNMARHLVEHCGLILWLSSVVFSPMSLNGDQDMFSSNKLTMLLEVVFDVLSLQSTMDWLQAYALEQLSDLSTHLFKILVGGSQLVEINSDLIYSVLEVISSALRISQKRRIYQPHFTISVKGLCQAYEAIDLHYNVEGHPYHQSALKAMLMRPPPVAIKQMDQGELSSFLIWAVPTALLSDSQHLPQHQESYPYSQIHTGEETCEGSLTTKLLRWLVASVILGTISCEGDEPDPCLPHRQANEESFLSLVGHYKKRCEGKSSVSASEVTLAAAVFHLQQQQPVGMSCMVLPSAVAALSLLLLVNVSYATVPGSASTLDHGNALPLLWSRICYPPEADPNWRWSFDQPWADLSSHPSDLKRMDERHACQTLLVYISKALEMNSSKSDFRLLSPEDLKKSGVFQWEKSILVEAE